MASTALKHGTQDFLARLGSLSADPLERRRQAHHLRGPDGYASAEPERIRIGPIDAEATRPPLTVDCMRLVLCFHHGGYVAGDAAGLRRFASTIAHESNARVLCPNYRLAPEHRFPTAINDAVRVYRWVLDEGWPPAAVAVGGASAGGGLALASLVAIRDSGLPMPAAGFAVSPWTDLTLSSESMCSADSLDPLSDRSQMQKMVTAYLGKIAPTHYLASPLFADLANLPPIHLEVGRDERLVDDARSFRRAAQVRGVTSSLRETPDGIHCFPIHVPDAPESQSAIRRIAAHINRYASGA
jgi:epsilon-lactone hydrolase